jgi:thioesterase domain-containing protein
VDQGEEVALLVLFDTVSPVLANQALSRVRYWNADYLWHRPVRGVGRRISRLLGNQTASYGEISPEVLERDRALIREHLANDEIIPEELRGIHLYDSYMEAQKLYRPTPLPVPTLLFRATEQEKRFQGERLLGWKGLITGPIEVRHIKSNHLGLMSRTSVERMCAVLRKRIDSLIEGVPPAKRTSQLSSFAKWVAKVTSTTPTRAPTTNRSN